MLRRMCLALLGTAVAVALAGATTWAADDPNVHEGLVVSAGNGKLVMTDADGQNQHTHAIGADVQITLDDKPAKLADLKEGFQVKVTTAKEGNQTVVTRIEATTA
jgi:hypothetical protein